MIITYKTYITYFKSPFHLKPVSQNFEVSCPLLLPLVPSSTFNFLFKNADSNLDQLLTLEMQTKQKSISKSKARSGNVSIEDHFVIQ